MMKWRVRKIGTRDRALHRWHTWFAWYPVRVPTRGRGSGQTMIWLSPVRRKGTLTYSWAARSWSWEYKMGCNDTFFTRQEAEKNLCFFDGTPTIDKEELTNK